MRRFTILVCSIMMIGLLNHCSDQGLNVDESLPELRASATDEEQVAHFQSYMDVFANGIGELADNNEFRSFIYNRVEKRFDGEVEALLKDLVLPTASDGQFAGMLQDAIEQHAGGVERANGFLRPITGLDKKNYYPHLFIPFYDELKEKGRIGTENPVIVANAISDQATLKGLQVTNSGLKEMPFMIDEAFAKNHEVWVITINERVDNDGVCRNSFTQKGNEEAVSARTAGTAHPNGTFYSLQVNSHRESWASGGSEIHIKRYKTWYSYDAHPPVNAAAYASPNDDLLDGSGWKIRDYSRNEIDNHDVVVINWQFAPDWANKTVNGYHTDYLAMLIFEYDPAPVTEKWWMLLDEAGSGYYYNTRYRSSDGPYHALNFAESTADGATIADAWSSIVAEVIY